MRGHYIGAQSAKSKRQQKHFPYPDLVWSVCSDNVPTVPRHDRKKKRKKLITVTRHDIYLLAFAPPRSVHLAMLVRLVCATAEKVSVARFKEMERSATFIFLYTHTHTYILHVYAQRTSWHVGRKQSSCGKWLRAATVYVRSFVSIFYFAAAGRGMRGCAQRPPLRMNFKRWLTNASWKNRSRRK